MKYYVRMDKLKEEGESIRKFAREKIDYKVDHLSKLRRDIGWISPASEDFDYIYKEMVDKLFDLGTVMEKLGSFLEYSSEHYGETNEQVISDWQALMEELDAQRQAERARMQ